MADRAEEHVRVAGDGIDVVALRRRVAEGLASRQTMSVDVEANLVGFQSRSPTSTDDRVADALDRVARLMDRPLPAELMRPSQSTLDRVLDCVRRPLHALARYYADAQAARQDEINYWLLSAVRAQADELAQLRGEVDRSAEQGRSAG